MLVTPVIHAVCNNDVLLPADHFPAAIGLASILQQQQQQLQRTQRQLIIPKVQIGATKLSLHRLHDAFRFARAKNTMPSTEIKLQASKICPKSNISVRHSSKKEKKNIA